MKAYGGVDVEVHIFLDFGTSWMWVVSFMHRPLYPRGKSRRYKLDRRLGDPRTGLDDMEKSPDHTGTLNSDPSVVQPLTSRYSGSSWTQHETVLQ
jgi:hypothetical protein